jgi:hypothetical protein
MLGAEELKIDLGIGHREKQVTAPFPHIQLWGA